MQRSRHLLQARLFETLFHDRQSLVERHSRLQQMGELLGKNEQLSVRDLQALGCWRRCRFFTFPRCFRHGENRFDLNRDALLHFDLPNRDRPIGAIQHALDQTALRISSSIGKLWHGSEISPKSEIRNLNSIVLFLPS